MLLLGFIIMVAPALFTANVPEVQHNTDREEIVWATTFLPWDLDPISSADNTVTTQVISQMMQGLTVMDPTVSYADLQGALAYDWHRADPYTWYFYLRSGIYFHDGAYFNAEVVVMNAERFLGPDAIGVTANITEMIKYVEALDDYIVRVTTNAPFAPLASVFANRSTFMVSPYAIEEELTGGRPISENPMGTGPFVFCDRTWDGVVMVRNDNYWGGKVLPDSIRVTSIPDMNLRAAKLSSGEVNLIIGTQQDYARVFEMPQVYMRRFDSTVVDYIGFNMNHPVLSDARVRRGIAHAVDREFVIDYISGGWGTISHGPAAPFLIHAPQGQSPEFDPLYAAGLFAEAGITQQNRVTLNFWYNEGNMFRGVVGDFVQSVLAEYGIDVVVTAVEWGTFLYLTGEGEHDMFMLGWGAVGGDADGIYPIFHSSHLGHAGNRSFIVNDRVDYLLDRARATMDDNERNYLYEELMELLNYEKPMVFLRIGQVVVLTNGIDNLHVNFTQVPDLRGVTFIND